MSSETRERRLAIVAAEFCEPIVEPMILQAQTTATRLGALIERVVRVPGCYEAPLLVDHLLSDPTIDAVVVLGFIERGHTMHGEVMGHVVHRTIVDLELKYRKPVGIGIIGPGATLEQAQERKLGYATSAVSAALTVCEVLKPTAPGG